MSSVDENIQIITDALEYYNSILLQMPEKSYEDFSFVKMDFEHERKNISNVIGLLQSETPIESVLGKHQRCICASLKTYKSKLEKIKRDIKEEIQTEPEFPALNKKLHLIEEMIRKVKCRDMNWYLN